jgi:hypothetical protein
MMILRFPDDGCPNAGIHATTHNKMRNFNVNLFFIGDNARQCIVLVRVSFRQTDERQLPG